MAALEYPLVIAVPSVCTYGTDQPTLAVAFINFITDISHETMAAFFNAVIQVNPEWLEGAKKITAACMKGLGVELS